jgi:TorA maturation chaperone TorD
MRGDGRRPTESETDMSSATNIREPHATDIELPDDTPLDLACETLYRFLGALLADPRGDAARLVFDPASQQITVQAADLLRTEFAERAIPLGFGELPAEDLDLQPLVAELTSTNLREEYVRVFGLLECRECPPYETEYCPNEDTFYRSQQMADVAGFYRAFGLAPAGLRERPDHLSLELEFAALLLLKKRLARTDTARPNEAADEADVCHAARASFFRDHLSWWVPSFALALRSKAEQGVYAQAGRVLAALLPIERSRLNVRAPQMPLTARVEAPEECAGCLASTT